MRVKKRDNRKQEKRKTSGGTKQYRRKPVKGNQ